jgi:hypothetical protein
VVHVRFSPDSNGDYDDLMRLVTESGEIPVPLKGRRQPPRLTLDEKLESGFCFTDDTVSSLFDFTNEGGVGKFCIVPESWEEAPEAVDIQDELQLGCFSVTPCLFEVAQGGHAQLRVNYSPAAVCKDEEHFLMLCDNCEVRHLNPLGAVLRTYILYSLYGVP